MPAFKPRITSGDLAASISDYGGLPGLR